MSVRPEPMGGAFRAAARSPHSIPGVLPIGVVLPNLRPPCRQLAEPGSRRPVIAVVDTAIDDHPWLRDEPGMDPFWRLPGDEPHPWRRPVLRTAEGGDPTATTRGHGTFIAGIIRQLAPKATILSLPVMNDYERAETNDVLDALQWLLELVDSARKAKRPDLFVDVVNLSFGWYRDERMEDFPEAEYRSRLDGLADAGVQVVASAGNMASEERIYPAAFADDKLGTSESATQLVSVGALDPDGARSRYSNYGKWVTRWAPGTGLISTVPFVRDVEWPTWRCGYTSQTFSNPNFAARGFARWDGTSFASAWVSAKVAHHLANDDHLDDLEPDAVRARAKAALAATEDDIADWTSSHDATG